MPGYKSLSLPGFFLAFLTKDKKQKFVFQAPDLIVFPIQSGIPSFLYGVVAMTNLGSLS